MVAVAIIVALILQLFAVVILVFGDIGFDHPGRYGLHFDHGIKLVALYVVALAFGVIVCVVKKKWLLLGAQAIIPVLLVARLIVPTPNPRVDAAQYQHLVGKTKAEAHSELSGFRVWVSGATDGMDFETYNGMEIYYSAAGQVAKVDARD